MVEDEKTPLRRVSVFGSEAGPLSRQNAWMRKAWIAHVHPILSNAARGNNACSVISYTSIEKTRLPWAAAACEGCEVSTKGNRRDLYRKTWGLMVLGKQLGSQVGRCHVLSFRIASLVDHSDTFQTTQKYTRERVLSCNTWMISHGFGSKSASGKHEYASLFLSGCTGRDRRLGWSNGWFREWKGVPNSPSCSPEILGKEGTQKDFCCKNQIYLRNWMIVSLNHGTELTRKNENHDKTY